MMKPSDMEEGSLAVQEQAPPPPVDMYFEGEEKMRRRKMLAVALLVLAVVGIALGVGLAFSLNRGGEAEAKDVEAAGGTDADAKDRSYVNDVCSVDSLSTSDGAAICEEICQGAECCQDFSDTGTCLDDNLDYCVAHSRCHVVKDADSFRPAPADLESICSLKGIASDRTRCEDACRPAECCFTNDLGSCQGTNFLACLDYSFCQNLNDFSSLSPAPTELDTICSDESLATEAGAQKCNSICENASCCTASDDSCLQSDFISCVTYTPCGKLSIYGEDYSVPPAPKNLNELCSKDKVLSSQASVEKCLDACRAASCCAASDDTNCFLTDPGGCLEYASCGVLFSSGEGSILKPSPVGISDDCALDNIQDGNIGRSDCEAVCKDSSCCFDMTSSGNCLGGGNLFSCLDYTDCLNLNLTPGQQPEIPAGDVGGDMDTLSGTLEEPDGNISHACDLLNVLQNGTSDECKRICAKATCCSSEKNNCYDENGPTCDLYGLCASLVVLGGND